jgi:hypothetical protein
MYNHYARNVFVIYKVTTWLWICSFRLGSDNWRVVCATARTEMSLSCYALRMKYCLSVSSDTRSTLRLYPTSLTQTVNKVPHKNTKRQFVLRVCSSFHVYCRFAWYPMCCVFAHNAVEVLWVFWKSAAREGPAYGSKWNCSYRETVWRFENKERFGKVCVRHLKCCCWVLSCNVSIAEHNLCDRLYSSWPKCSCFWVLTTIHTPWRYYVRSTRNVMPIWRSLQCLPRAYFILSVFRISLLSFLRTHLLRLSRSATSSPPSFGV